MAANVLVLSTQDSAPRHMTEAFLRKYGAYQYDIYTTGFTQKSYNPLTIQVMQEAGIDLCSARFRATHIDAAKLRFQYLIHIGCDAKKNPPLCQEITNRMDWSFDDPACFHGPQAEKLARFRKLRDRIEQKVLDWFVTIF